MDTIHDIDRPSESNTSLIGSIFRSPTPSNSNSPKNNSHSPEQRQQIYSLERRVQRLEANTDNQTKTNFNGTLFGMFMVGPLPWEGVITPSLISYPKG